MTSPTRGMRVALGVGALVLAALGAWLLAAAPEPAGEAALELRVTPAGAQVKLVTPVQMRERALGGRLVLRALPANQAFKAVVSAPGYAAMSVAGTLGAPGSTTRRRVDLKKDTAGLRVVVEPAGASVFLDGSAMGQAPLYLRDVAPGPHHISAAHPGYMPGGQDVVVREGADTSVHLQLARDPDAAGTPRAVHLVRAAGDETKTPQHGRVTVSANVQARFVIDAQIVGFGRGASRLVRQGEHVVAAIAEGHPLQSKHVVLEEGEHVTLEFAFEDDGKKRRRAANDPDQPLYWVLKGAEARNGGAYATSVPLFERALALDPNDPEAHRQLGATFPAMGRWRDAEKHIAHYLDLAPDAPNAAFMRDMLKHVQARAEAAEAGEEWHEAPRPGVGVR